MSEFKIFILSLNIVIFSSMAYAVDDIAVMGLIKDQVILRINGIHHTIGKDISVVNGVKLLEIDKDRKSVTLEVDGITKKYRLGHGTKTATASIKLLPDSSGVYKAFAKINNKQVEYIIDTGATLVSLNSNIATKLGIDYKKATQTVNAETASGVVQVYLVTLDSIEIGEIKIKNVAAAVHEGNFPSMVLLGMSFLNQFDMEREGGVLSLQLK
jgi:aspartyl protease family protein